MLYPLLCYLSNTGTQPQVEHFKNIQYFKSLKKPYLLDVQTLYKIVLCDIFVCKSHYCGFLIEWQLLISQINSCKLITVI